MAATWGWMTPASISDMGESFYVADNGEGVNLRGGPGARGDRQVTRPLTFSTAVVSNWITVP